MKYVHTSFYTRHPCHVCGGVTEKDEWLVEGETEHGHTVRACHVCRASDDIDARLERTAASLEEQAKATRALKGRLRMPGPGDLEAARAEDERQSQAQAEELKRRRAERTDDELADLELPF